MVSHQIGDETEGNFGQIIVIIIIITIIIITIIGIIIIIIIIFNRNMQTTSLIFWTCNKT